MAAGTSQATRSAWSLPGRPICSTCAMPETAMMVIVADGATAAPFLRASQQTSTGTDISANTARGKACGGGTSSPVKAAATRMSSATPPGQRSGRTTLPVRSPCGQRYADGQKPAGLTGAIAGTRLAAVGSVTPGRTAPSRRPPAPTEHCAAEQTETHQQPQIAALTQLSVEPTGALSSQCTAAPARGGAAGRRAERDPARRLTGHKASKARPRGPAHIRHPIGPWRPPPGRWAPTPSADWKRTGARKGWPGWPATARPQRATAISRPTRPTVDHRCRMNESRSPVDHSAHTLHPPP